ncbi:transcriptional regulator, IclR family [Halorubrum aquaticum]|uniref:Transcriptional regulator, IclR family n=1 Tax=Halorubrum aquaticum TaxID=387340 RepID=A0A1I3B9Z2_9EURY|nr:helix-turn-helix domain-containing protein [Halorubrum aquaticum]SFH58531.1 transcriptional regulator, IclR family [Halorubrum aquaticum]
MAEPSPNRVGTTEKSLTILELLQQEDGAGVTEVATTLEMSKSTVHSHLSTLVDCGYVTHHDRQYHVSTKLLRLGGRLRDQSPLYQAARIEMKSLAAETDGVVHLFLKEESDATMIAQEGYYPGVRERHLGERTPLSESIVGPVMLAERERSDDGEPDDAPEEDDVSQVDDDVRDRFDRIRRRGYAVETRSGSSDRTFAGVLSRQDGTVMGALTVTVPGDSGSPLSAGDRLLEAIERVELSLTSWYDSQATFSPKHSWHVHSN